MQHFRMILWLVSEKFAKNLIFRHFTAFLQACPWRASILPHKPSMSNHEVYWPLSTCKILVRSYDQFLKKQHKTLFFCILRHFCGMPKACQIFPAQTIYVKSSILLASINMQNFRTILWPVFEKFAKNPIFGQFTAFLRACPGHASIFPHKPPTSNHKVYLPLSTYKILGRSYDRFLRKQRKTLFFAFYGIFAGMPKACQIFPAQITYVK